MRRLTFLVELLDGGLDCGGELGCVFEGAVGEVVPLEVAPAPFDGVQLRRVPGQPLDGDPGTWTRGSLLRQAGIAVLRRREAHAPP